MRLSFEIFPARKPDHAQKLEANLKKLRFFSPEFVSVTCGAMGSSRNGTAEWVNTVHRLGMTPYAHITSAPLMATDLVGAIDTALDAGARGVVALRGDMPDGGAPKSCVLSLIEAAKGKARVCVSGYPTPHPESQGKDLDWLRQKQDAGAQEIITQFTYNPHQVVRFRDSLQKAGITMTVRPGLLPFHNWAGAKRFGEKTGVPMDADLDTAFTQSPTPHALASRTAHRFLDTWADEGITQAHIYTLNTALDWLVKTHQDADLAVA